MKGVGRRWKKLISNTLFQPPLDIRIQHVCFEKATQKKPNSSGTSPINIKLINVICFLKNSQCHPQATLARTWTKEQLLQGHSTVLCPIPWGQPMVHSCQEEGHMETKYHKQDTGICLSLTSSWTKYYYFALGLKKYVGPSWCGSVVVST